AHVVLGELAEVRRVALREVHPDPGGDEDLAYAFDHARLAHQGDERPVVRPEELAHRGVHAALPLARRLHLRARAAHAVHVRRRAADVAHDAGEARVLGHRADLRENALLAPALDDAA